MKDFNENFITLVRLFEDMPLQATNWFFFEDKAADVKCENESVFSRLHVESWNKTSLGFKDMSEYWTNDSNFSFWQWKMHFNTGRDAFAAWRSGRWKIMPTSTFYVLKSLKWMKKWTGFLCEISITEDIDQIISGQEALFILHAPGGGKWLLFSVSGRWTT